MKKVLAILLAISVLALSACAARQTAPDTQNAPVYPAESGFVLRRGNSGVAHHDEPEPAGGKGSPPRGE